MVLIVSSTFLKFFKIVYIVRGRSAVVPLDKRNSGGPSQYIYNATDALVAEVLNFVACFDHWCVPIC